MRKLKESFSYVLNKYNGKPLIALAVIIFLMILSNTILNKENTSTKNDSNSISLNESYSNKKNTESEDILSIYGIKEIKIDEGSAEAELNYINPEQNADKFYIRISITLKDSQECIYMSDLLPAGRGVDVVKLSRSFDKGVYPAVFHIQGYKTNDLSSAKGADFDIDIIVE
jgi:hypothetical protein